MNNNANASAKSKELASQRINRATVAPHLLLPSRTQSPPTTRQLE